MSKGVSARFLRDPNVKNRTFCQGTCLRIPASLELVAAQIHLLAKQNIVETTLCVWCENRLLKQRGGRKVSAAYSSCYQINIKVVTPLLCCRFPGALQRSCSSSEIARYHGKARAIILKIWMRKRNLNGFNEGGFPVEASEPPIS